MKYVIPFLVMALAGCAGKFDGLKPTSINPVCAALLGPIRTNTFNPGSKRYLPLSSTELRGDIKQHNQVGQNLDCPTYRR